MRHFNIPRQVGSLCSVLGGRIPLKLANAPKPTSADSFSHGYWGFGTQLIRFLVERPLEHLAKVVVKLAERTYPLRNTVDGQNPAPGDGWFIPTGAECEVLGPWLVGLQTNVDPGLISPLCWQGGCP